MTIREARPDDLDRLVAVNRAAATAAYAPIFGDTPYPGTGVRRRYQRMLGNPCVRVFVAEQDEDPLGYAAARAGRLDYITDDVPTILGRPARSFQQFARDHQAAFSPVSAAA